LATASTLTPERTCVGCRTKRPQTELVRCAVSAEGVPVISRTAAGRGAWLCEGQVNCLRQAIKRRGFERAWKRPVGPAELELLTIAYEAMTSNMEN
jgi:predicted RNA-binding protein YlxR (DUF448 family)